MIRRTIATLSAVAICIGLAAFTEWGFDPASWEPPARLMFGAFTIWIVAAVYFFPGWKD